MQSFRALSRRGGASVSSPDTILIPYENFEYGRFTHVGRYGGGIKIVDSGGNTSVAFGDSGPNAYANPFTVALSNSSAGSITFGGRSDFGIFNVSAATANRIAVSNGAVLTTSSGNISLQANQHAPANTGDFSVKLKDERKRGIDDVISDIRDRFTKAPCES